MAGQRRAKTAADAAINTEHPKRRRLDTGAVSTEAAPDAPAASAASPLLDDTSMSYSSRNSVVDFLNNWAAKSIQPGRELQKRLLDEEEQGQSHPALQYTRSPGWSDADEAQAEALWEAEREQWKLGADKGYTTLWKVCLQFAQCTPWDIVGERTRLRFASDNANGIRVQSNCMWSKAFCIALAQIVTHIIWPRQFDGAHAMNVAAAIQYAVILRTNDQRPWDPAPGSLDPLCKMMREYKEQKPVVMRHQEIRKRCAETKTNLSVMSSVFLALEAEVLTPSTRLRLRDQDEMYAVKTQDLQAVIGALDKMHAPRIGTLGYLSAAAQHFAAMEARPCQTFPSNNEVAGVAGVHEAAMREEMRRRIERRRIERRQLQDAGHGSEEVENNDDNGNDDDGNNDDNDDDENEINRIIESLQARVKQLCRRKQRDQPGRTSRPVDVVDVVNVAVKVEVDADIDAPVKTEE